jgi:hypothetical protein
LQPLEHRFPVKKWSKLKTKENNANLLRKPF